MTTDEPIEKVYEAAFPVGRHPYKNVPGMKQNHEYVYILRDATGAAVYVGRSFRPADRFTKHRRKPWWTVVAHLTVLQIVGRDHIDAEMRGARLERALIAQLQPYGNLVPGQRRSEWYGAHPIYQA